MKILLVGPAMGLPIPANGWGGIEKVIWKHACELIKRGHEVDILNDRGTSRIEFFDNWKAYDVIHVHQEWCYEELRSRNIPFIFTSHMSSWQRNWDSVGRFLTDCAMSMPFEMMSDRLNKDRENGLVKQEFRMWPIWNGADASLFKPLNKEPGLSLAVGKEEPRKKFEQVIERVQSSGGRLLLVGPGNEKHTGRDNVQILGNLSEEKIAILMGQAEFFYHLADEEADCLVVKEAAMAGCKLILSEYCEKTFFATARFCSGLWPEGPGFVPGLARELSKQRYTWEKVVDNLEEGYLWHRRLLS